MTDFDFDRLGEQLAREQDGLLARHNAQAEVRARLAQLDVATLRKSAQASATRRASSTEAISPAKFGAVRVVVPLTLPKLPMSRSMVPKLLDGLG